MNTISNDAPKKEIPHLNTNVGATQPNTIPTRKIDTSNKFQKFFSVRTALIAAIVYTVLAILVVFQELLLSVLRHSSTTFFDSSEFATVMMVSLAALLLSLFAVFKWHRAKKH